MIRPRTPSLGDVLSGPNAFDLVRLACALAVMWSHNGFFTTAEPLPDFVSAATGGVETAGSAAVQAFFLMSGMMVTASVERRGSLVGFAVARLARVWPALVVAAALIALVVVPAASGFRAGSAHGYMAEVRHCLRTDAAFPVVGVCDTLSLAFPGTPLPGVFGFTWWTLPVEVHCYALVLALGLAFSFRPTDGPRRRVAFLAATTLAAVVYGAWVSLPFDPDSVFYGDTLIQDGYGMRPVWFFLAGMALYAVREGVAVDGRLALALLAAAWMLPGHPALVHLALGYGVLAAGASPALRRLAPAWDVSYGTYLYGASMQQVVATVAGPTASPALALPWSVLAALLCGGASWFLVERPALLGRAWVSAKLRRGGSERGLASALGRWSRRRFPAGGGIIG